MVIVVEVVRGRRDFFVRSRQGARAVQVLGEVVNVRA